jgi:hypothetical protein
MNERIRELWAKAGGHYDTGNQHTWPQYTIDDPEKFAELIIQECCQALHPMLRDQISRGQGVDLIKQHFGVEE